MICFSHWASGSLSWVQVGLVIRSVWPVLKGFAVSIRCRDGTTTHLKRLVEMCSHELYAVAVQIRWTQFLRGRASESGRKQGGNGCRFFGILVSSSSQVPEGSSVLLIC